MPITVYVDGSGTGDSPVLTLAAYAMEDGLLAPFATKWNETIQRHGVQQLHMRKLGDGGDAGRSGQMICDLFNVFHNFREEFFYFRVCSVVRSDHAEALRTMHLLKSPELLCVDFCLGGLSIPTADADTDNSVKIYFDRNEPFMRHMRSVWEQTHRKLESGWPRQVEKIESESSHHPGLQAADLFAWAVHRHLLHEDHPLLAFSLLPMPQRYRIYDLHTIRGLHDASGRYSESIDPSFEATQFRIRFS